MTIQNKYTESEIEKVLAAQSFKHVYVPAFKFPSEVTSIKSPYNWYKSYLQIAAPLLVLPAFIFVFTFLFNGNSSKIVSEKESNLVLLQESNNRLLAEIESLDQDK